MSGSDLFGSSLGIFHYCGTFFRGGQKYIIEISDGALLVSCISDKALSVGWTEAFPFPLVTREAFEGRQAMASKWIGKALQRREPRTALRTAKDDGFFKERPAIKEFMTVLVDDSGEAREPSVIMLALGDEEVRAGIKDADANLWGWRVGDTVEEALDALEKALQEGKLRWGGRKQGRPQKKA